jgi:hypothetical protein
VKSGIRFHPPWVELSAETRWVLRRAFGPPNLQPQPIGELVPGTVFDLAQHFSLTERIGWRSQSVDLEEELGKDCAQRFREATVRSTALSLIVDRVCHEIAGLGAELGIPAIFLKGAALQLAGRTPSGSRNMCDVDVLVPEEAATTLQSSLMAGGCSALEVRESEHQLQFLTHKTGLGIEIHKIIPGIRLGGRSSAMAVDLIERGHVRPAPELRDGCYLPGDELMFAHVMVHGIAQHGMSPQAYPMARMLADVQDLGIDETDLAAFLERGYLWIAADVSREEVEAVVRLAQRLEAGEDPQVVAATEDDVGTLLRHLVAGTIDQSYAQSMKFRSLIGGPKDVGLVRGLAKTLRGALLPTRAQIDILYGPPRTELGYWGWRLWRPFDLVLRAARYGKAWVYQRIRPKT